MIIDIPFLILISKYLTIQSLFYVKEKYDKCFLKKIIRHCIMGNVILHCSQLLLLLKTAKSYHRYISSIVYVLAIYAQRAKVATTLL